MHIVLVDENQAIRDGVAGMLTARSHDVRAFADGWQAIAYIKDHKEVDALIAGSAPGSLGGVDLCWQGRLLADAQRPIYVVLMSSSRDAHSLAEALDCGADEFIDKPPRAEELYARLRTAERVLGMQRELIRLAMTDPLTGMFNRRAFFQKCADACGRAGAGQGLAAIMFDLDKFKHVNDVYGHDVGDRVIKFVAERVMAESGDAIVGRLGGEEFVVVTEGRPLQDAAAFAEALRIAIAREPVETPKGALSVTASFGVSAWSDGDTIDEWLKRADVALYRAKTGGRNRVAVADAIDANERMLPGRVVRKAKRS
jgi:two-component system cell cycle response regulator